MTKEEFDNLRDFDEIEIVYVEDPTEEWDFGGMMASLVSSTFLKDEVDSSDAECVEIFEWSWSYDCLKLVEPPEIEEVDDFNKACFN